MDGAYPVIELDIVRIDETVLPVDHDGHVLSRKILRIRTGSSDHGIWVRRLDCSVFAYDLALDVISVTVRYLYLHIDKAAVLGSEQNHLRIVIFLGIG